MPSRGSAKRAVQRLEHLAEGLGLRWVIVQSFLPDAAARTFNLMWDNGAGVRVSLGETEEAATAAIRRAGSKR